MTDDDPYVPEVRLSDRSGSDEDGQEWDPSFGEEAVSETRNGASETADVAATKNGSTEDESMPDESMPDESVPDESVPDESMPDDVAHPSLADDDGVEPVELLVQLAEEGEIEPWDIDIVQVTDAFLEKLDAADLRTTGRALFYASVLLRMKSDEMLSDDDEEEAAPAQEPWEAAMEGGEVLEPGFDPVTQLEAEMDRRLKRKSTRGSPETLDELVRELRDAERGTWWKDSREYDTSGSPDGYDRGTQTLDYHAGDEFRRDNEPTHDDVTGGTHDEDIEDVIDDVQTSLRTQYDKGRNEVLFQEVERAGGRAFMTYLALLFLAHRGAIMLQQDDLFGDLWIRDAAVTSTETEAVAD